MQKKENRSRHIFLATPLGTPFEVNVLDIQSLVSLTPFVTDLLMYNGEVVAVEGTLSEVVEIIQKSEFPVFKNIVIDSRVNKIMNLDTYRRINWSE